jgi:predicted nucleic acid-binding protein
MPPDRRPWAYFDTSVLLERYVREEGSSRARAVLRRHRLLTSALSPLEALSALARRQAAGELRPSDFSMIRVRIRADRPYWHLIEVSALVLDRAEAVMAGSAVRTLDAIHVASALTFQSASGIRVPFVTGDARQQDAAGAESLEVVWVA